MTATTALRTGRRGQPTSVLGVIGALLTFAVLLLIVIPVVWMVYTAFRPESEIGRTTAISLTGFTMENFTALISYGFGRNVWNSLAIATSSAVISAILGVMAAYGFSRFRFRGRGLSMTLILALQLFPFVMIIGPLYGIYNTVSLTNSYVGLLIAYIAISQPFAVYMMYGFIETIPRSLDEAASIDGCNPLRTLIRVILPLSWPSLVAVLIFSFSLAWDEFVIASVLMTEKTTQTLPVALAGLFGEFGTRYGVVMAAAALGTLPTFLIFVFLQKYMVSNLAGAVKQ